MRIAFRSIINYIIALCVLGPLGCGERPEKEATPEAMIGDFTELAAKGASWDVLSERGLLVVDKVFAETDPVKRDRLVQSFRQTMRTLREPEDGEARRRRIWALKDISLRMRGCWGRIGKPEEAVWDWLFVLSKYRDELNRLGPVDLGRRVYLQSVDAESLRQKTYGNVMCDLNCDAESFENIVLPSALQMVTPEERKRIEVSFTEIVGRPPQMREQ